MMMHNFPVSLFIPGSTFYQPDCLLSDMDNIHTANGNVEPGDKHVGMAAAEGSSQNLNSQPRRLSPPSVAVETPKNTTATAETTNNVSVQPSPSPAPDRPEDQNNNNQRGCSPAHSAAGHASPSPSPPAPPSIPKVDIIISPHISVLYVSSLLILLRICPGNLEILHLNCFSVISSILFCL